MPADPNLHTHSRENVRISRNNYSIYLSSFYSYMIRQDFNSVSHRLKITGFSQSQPLTRNSKACLVFCCRPTVEHTMKSGVLTVVKIQNKTFSNVKPCSFIAL
jgi:hypothetical protein